MNDFKQTDPLRDKPDKEKVKILRRARTRLRKSGTKCREENNKLRERLASAEEALRFYAEKPNWVTRSGKIFAGTAIWTTDFEIHARGDYPAAGGKKARAYFEKWGGKG